MPAADVTLSTPRPEHLPALLALTLPLEQLQFTALPVTALPQLEGDAERLGVAILLDGGPVGFLVLSVGHHCDKYLDGPDRSALALSALSVRPDLQGRGVGLAAMRAVPDFARTHFPAARRVILAVNRRNPGARRLYDRAGFAVVGEREGLLGPQWVMQLLL